ncbi:hypothetical protein Agub_g6360 [Astrephomene gubernaculifera]|uniref:Uncharacterized protein n=1 Tax=Astrephomene gubernaculifera TaxID=47775 RepID=A0AAD3DNQ1_9CHLO|nr:hypothetical protein Agub_g6360 [Astrephomene gubernaculifera]
MEEEEFSLDEARETLFMLQRACERHAAALGNAVDSLNRKQPEDAWLQDVLDEAVKGVAFHQQQLASFTTFHSRVSAYVEAVRSEANELAIQELSGRPDTIDELQEDAGRNPGAAAEAAGAADDAAAASSSGAAPSRPSAAASRRQSSKMVHPELQKFKLEKQAKILGKYGGVPALGAGLVLPRLQRDSILKATASPAAREIHYSKVENKDATNLAEVFRFKSRKKEEGDSSPESGPSPWQSELSSKKGKKALDGTDEKDQVTPSTRTHTIYAEELGGVLQERQAALQQALEAERVASAGGGEQAGPHISAAALGELAAKLKQRQTAAKQMEAAAAAAEAEALEAAATPATPSWSNAAAPFGGELAAALQRRAEQQRQAGSGASPPLQQQQQQQQQKANGSSEGGSGQPQAQSVRRSAPPGLEAMLATPPGAAQSNELQEKLRRRLSTVDAQAPPPVASEAR